MVRLAKSISGEVVVASTFLVETSIFLPEGRLTRYIDRAIVNNFLDNGDVDLSSSEILQLIKVSDYL